MALTATRLEELATWCADCAELAAERAGGRRLFFSEDDPRALHYWPVAHDLAARERGFLGWFTLAYRLADGRLPAELAVERLRLPQPDDLLRSLRGSRCLLAIVGTVLPRSVFLELEDARFEVRQRSWARLLQRDRAVAAHLVPVRQGI